MPIMRGSSLELSAIFDWYKDGFKGKGGPVAPNKRSETPLPKDIKSNYQKYEWSLNEAK